MAAALTVDGPSVLVRKKFGDHFSVAYNYYEDMISSASIDVVTQASAYKEIRKQNSLSVDAIHGKSTYSARLHRQQGTRLQGQDRLWLASARTCSAT